MGQRFGRFSVASATLRGVEAIPVSVEVVVAPGLPGFSIVGMPDAAIQEARERIKASCRACGFSMPGEHVTVNLAPGSLKKSGSGFDLPIAVAILAATAQIDPALAAESLFVGELSLDGAIRPVPGLLAYALCARGCGDKFVCSEDTQDLVEIEGLQVFTVRTLSDLRREDGLETKAMPACAQSNKQLDFKDIAGHDFAKRALQIAATGRHGVLMMGPPGSGKTMLASRLPSILPPLSQKERIETAVIHSVANEPIGDILSGVRPFRSPHHSVSSAGLVGGGRPTRPGEVTLAHNGVLFLDELSEFKPAVLQAIRQPLESGEVVITRADGSCRFPAKFALVAATNPCPCGYFGDDDHNCCCTVPQVRNYQNRIGGPVMDRIDIHLNVQRLTSSDVLRTGNGTSSAKLREGVLAGREFADWRCAQLDTSDNLSPTERLLASCNLSNCDRQFFEDAVTKSKLSGRAIMRILALGRTIADLDLSEQVNRPHLYEAMSLRLSVGEEL